MPPPGDSRLLKNLLKAEQAAQDSFKSWTRDTTTATSALNAWVLVDSGDTQDLQEASQHISQLLAACADSQRNYYEALAAYRNALKDVLDRESDVRVVLRDRGLLVDRVIKLSNKKPSDSARDKHEQKLLDAQRELAGCESYLKNEELALSGAKRRIFREALAMRMKSLGELGVTLETSAREAIELLNGLGPGTPTDTNFSPILAAPYSMDDIRSWSPSPPGSPVLRSPDGNSIASGISSEIPSAYSTHAGAHRGGLDLSQAPPVPPMPSMGTPLAMSLPTAPRPVTESAIPMPAPPRVNDASSDEEDRRRPAAPATTRSGPRPLTQSTASEPVWRTRAMSEDSSVDPTASRKRRSGLFGSIASLFRRKERSYETRAELPPAWQTRTPTRPQPSGAGRQQLNEANLRRASVRDSDSDGGFPTSVVRHVNENQMRGKAMSDTGGAPQKKKKPRRAASDIGVAPPSPPMSDPGRPSSPRKMHKRRPLSITDAPKEEESAPRPSKSSSKEPTAPGLKRSTSVKSKATVASARSEMTTGSAQSETTVGKTKKKKSRSRDATVNDTPEMQLASTLPSANQATRKTLGTLSEETNGDKPTDPERTPTKPKTKKKSGGSPSRSGSTTWTPSQGGGENLMSLVDSSPKKKKKPSATADDADSIQSEGAKPSRRYGADSKKGATRAESSVGPASGANLDVPRPRPQSGDVALSSEANLVKRKSVRLDENPHNEPPRGASLSRSPSASQRSALKVNGTNGNAADLLPPPPSAPPGILVRHAAEALSTAQGGNPWPTRRVGAGDDSSDDDAEAEEYKMARKQFSKRDKNYKAALAGGIQVEGEPEQPAPPKVDKGKQRAVEQD